MTPILSSGTETNGERAFSPFSAHPILVLKRISKMYPGVRALSDVDLSVRAGEVHAIVGQNGAGKSTLLKIIAGLVMPDSGEIHVDGAPAVIDSPLTARSYGISAVPQELSLVKHVTVAENICMTQIPARHGFVNRKELRTSSEVDTSAARSGHRPLLSSR